MTHNRYPPPRTRPPAVVRAILRIGRVLAGLLATGLLTVLVAGVPYGLWHWIGWPLPHHVPTSTRIKDTLTGPFTDRILLDTLACLCWILWAVFLVDIADAIPDTLRNTRQTHTTAAAAADRRSGPLRGLAALLLAAIVAGLLSLRPHPASAARSTAPLAAPKPDTVATALHVERVSVPISTAPNPSSARTAVVQAPHDGIHDSLWRIAQRHLGDGARWPEIYQLNKGHPQPDGDSLTMPSLIQPGWIFQLPGPAIATTPTPPHAATPPPSTPSHDPAPAQPSPPLPPPTSSATTSAPVGQTPSAPSRPADQSGHSGIDLGDGVFVSLGLAGAISAAVLTERRRRRRRYVPGSGRRDDLLPIAPVVRSLHLAHLRTTESAAHGDTDIDEPDEREHADGLGSTSQPRWSRPDVETADSDELMHSVNDAAHNPRPAAAAPADSTGDLRATVAQALELAVTGGLGLVGPGADNALRGLMLEFLTSPGHPRPSALGPTSPAVQFGLDGADRPSGCDLVMPAATANHLLGHAQARRRPSRLHVTTDSGTALDRLEAIMLHRARLRRDRAGMGSAEQPPEPVVLTAHVPQDVQRLQAVLDNAAALGIGGLLIGQWRPGASLYVTADGRVTSTSPGPARHLHRKRLPTLTTTATHDLLNALTPDPDSVPTPAQADPPDDANAFEAAHAGASGGEMDGSHDRNGTAAPTADVTLDFFPPVHATSTVASELAHDAGPAATESPHDAAANLDAQGRALLRVLGPVQLTWRTAGQPAPDDDGQRVRLWTKTETVTVSLGPRQRELLLALALHPDGIARDLLADMLWPDTPPGRPFNALHTTLNRLRRNLAAATADALTEFTRTDGDRYQLDPQVVATDYQQLQAALAARRAATDDESRAQACRAILAAYTGELGEGASPDWAETLREAVRRDVLDAAVTLARYAATTDPQEAFDVLETARSLDPYNEQLYRDIMRLQHRLGRVSSIGHTLALLTTQLTEIDQTPEPPTITLAQRLTSPAPSNRDASQPDDNGAGSHLPAAG